MNEQMEKFFSELEKKNQIENSLHRLNAMLTMSAEVKRQMYYLPEHLFSDLCRVLNSCWEMESLNVEITETLNK